MTLYVFCGPGTWECDSSNYLIMPVGMTKYLTEGLPDQESGHQIVQRAIGYTAGYGDRASYVDSVNDLKTKLTGAIKHTPDMSSTLIALVGYSQGATGCGDIARDIANGTLDIGRRKFLQYYGVADPRRAAKDFFAGPRVPGVGVTGERPNEKGGTGWATQFCIPGDIIASTIPDETLFEYITPITSRFWVGDPLQWLSYVGETLRSKKVQEQIRKDFPGILGYLRFVGRRNKTLELITKYVLSGVHGRYVEHEVSKGVTVGDYICQDILNRTKLNQI